MGPVNLSVRMSFIIGLAIVPVTISWPRKPGLISAILVFIQELTYMPDSPIFIFPLTLLSPLVLSGGWCFIEDKLVEIDAGPDGL